MYKQMISESTGIPGHVKGLGDGAQACTTCRSTGTARASSSQARAEPPWPPCSSRSALSCGGDRRVPFPAPLRHAMTVALDLVVAFHSLQGFDSTVTLQQSLGAQSMPASIPHELLGIAQIARR